MATLLVMAQNVAGELGLASPSSVIGSTDQQVVQLLALFNRAGKALVDDHPWSALTRETTVTCTNGVATYALAADYDRMIPQSWWDVTNRWPLLGPMSYQEWDTIKKGITITGPRKRFRIIGTPTGTYVNPSANTRYIELDPTPTNSTDQFFYSWISKGFARQTTDTTAGQFDADSDEPLLDSDLFELDVKWRYLRAKGLPYDEERIEFDDALARIKGADQAYRSLWNDASAQMFPRLLDMYNVPDTGFGS